MKLLSLDTQRIKAIFTYKTKLYRSNELYSVKAVPNQEDVVRISIISGKKKLGKSAVNRNTADRRLRAALQCTLSNYSLKGHDLLFFTLPSVITKPWPEFLSELNQTLKSFEKQIKN